jgi:GNAT superfamily N-acetyltransferase
MGEHIELRRVTDEAGAVPCDELFRDYLAWLSGQLRARHAVPIDDDEVEGAHATFRLEWPKLFGERGRLLLALVEGRPSGVAVLKPVSVEVCELKRMYVRPEARGLGVAGRLLDQLVHDARAIGYASMRLETFDFMTAAHGLYRRAGFVDIPPFEGTEGGDHGVADFEVCMAVDLGTSTRTR